MLPEFKVIHTVIWLYILFVGLILEIFTMSREIFSPPLMPGVKVPDSAILKGTPVTVGRKNSLSMKM